MVDDEKHKPLSKRDRKDYMRHYMRERRKRVQPQPAPDPQDLHGPVAPKNLPRTESAKALLQAHYAHVLSLWAETGNELARLKDTDEVVSAIESLMLDNKHLQDENKRLQEALKTCQGNRPQETLQGTSKPCQGNLQENLPPPLPATTKPFEPGLVDPDRRPSLADDTPGDWMA